MKKTVYRVVIWALAAFGAAAGTPAHSGDITWRVDHPFRYLSKARDLELHRSIFRGLSAQERDNPILSAERRLGRLYPRGWAEKVFTKICNGRSAANGGCDPAHNIVMPREHRVVANYTGTGPDARSGRCSWRIRAVRRKMKKYDKTLTAACGVAVEFKVPYPGGVSVKVYHGGRPAGRVRASDRVRVKDIFVVGMGDSFASGEGNPDSPVTFSRERSAVYGKLPQGAMLAGYPARVGAWRKIGDAEFVKSNARWSNQACHRSLYSHQFRTALQLSMEEPHRAVTYADFACAGAEITYGLFRLDKGNEWAPERPSLSQLSAVADAQCGTRGAPDRDYPHAYHMKRVLPDLEDIVLKKCPKKQARKIDLLLLSVGGNDVGFTRLVANAVLADETILRRLGGWMGLVYGSEQANGDVKELKTRYKALNRAIHNLLHIPWSQPDRVILTAYPVLALLEDGRSVCPDSRAGMSVLPDFSLNNEKARDGEVLSDLLHGEMRKGARRHGWSFAHRHRTVFAGHSICAGSDNGDRDLANDLRIPKYVNGQWHPFNPADYEPYAPRARWFRTPNDAYLTGHFHVNRTIARKLLKNKKLRWFQLVLASTYSGAFHPTAEGQAVIADEVTRVARKVLDKYGQ